MMLDVPPRDSQVSLQDAEAFKAQVAAMEQSYTGKSTLEKKQRKGKKRSAPTNPTASHSEQTAAAAAAAAAKNSNDAGTAAPAPSHSASKKRRGVKRPRKEPKAKTAQQ